MLLTYGASPDVFPWERIRSAYARFEKVCGRETRISVLQTLAAFSSHMKGQGLRVWEPVFRCDSDAALRQAAAHAAIVLASVKEKSPLLGVEEMLAYLVREENAECLNGVFLTCDMRFLPLAEEAWRKLPVEKRVWSSPPVLSYPSVEFHVRRLEAGIREERETMAEGLVAMPDTAISRAPVCFYHPFPASHPDYDYPQVIDAVTPVPAWKYADTPPQVLHTWTCPEYLPRFLPRIEACLTGEEKERLVRAWSRTG